MDEGRPLELILTRNLVSIISLPAVLIDADGRVVFYNDGAARIIGQPFEEMGAMSREEWKHPLRPRRRARGRGRG